MMDETSRPVYAPKMRFSRVELFSLELGTRALLVIIFSITLYGIIPYVGLDIHLSSRGPQTISKKIFIVEVDGLYQVKDFLDSFDTEPPFHFLAYRNSIIQPTETKPFMIFYKKPIEMETDERNSKYLEINLFPDSDGLLRRYWGNLDFSKNRSFTDEENLINYRGQQWTFPRIYLEELSKENYSRFDGSIIIIENRLNPISFVTPLGSIPESEIMANIIDNQIEGRKSRFLSNFQLFFIALALLILCFFCSLYLPALFSLTAIFGIAISYVFLTLFLFDQMYIRMPFLAPLLQILVTYLVFSNFRQSKEEYDKWKFKQRILVDEELNSMKNNFLSLFSHDLKTPLAKIIGLSEKLGNTLDDKASVVEIDKIKSLSKKLQSSIQRILKISLLESHSLKLQKNQEDLNQIVEATIKKAQVFTEEKNVSIQFEKEVLFLVDMDRVLIEEVIFNFIENAIKYGEQNGKIWVSTFEKEDKIHLNVEDNGPGIPKEQMEQVWTKFYREKNGAEGYGLGLYLSRYVINLHGGEIFLKQSQHGGCHFGFKLPT